MLPNVEYENLKQDISKIADSTTSLEIVKYWFLKDINSRRSFTRVQTLDDLFNLLEIRDILHSNDVAALHYLGQKLNNQEIINLVKGYEKLYVEQSSCICGGNSFSPPNLIEEIKNSDEKNLDSAIDNIAFNIGTNWSILARELNIPEHYIDKIRDTYPTDAFQQAKNALQVWKKYSEDSATFDTLKRALQARLCKMKGIGLHLLKPVIAVG